MAASHFEKWTRSGEDPGDEDVGRRVTNHITCCPLTFVGLEFHARFSCFSWNNDRWPCSFERTLVILRMRRKHMSSQYSGIFLELLISSARSTKVHSVLAPSRHPVGSLSEGSLSEPQQRRQREHHQTKGLMSETIAVHVRFESVYISLPCSAKQQRELTKFWVVHGTWTTTATFSYFHLELNAVVACLA